MSAQKLEKWDVIEVWCHDLRKPHYKYCVCICPKDEIFFFINSDLPEFRKAREVAVPVARHETNVTTHDSFIDSTQPKQFQDDRVAKAMADPNRYKGPIAPFLRERIVAAAKGHGTLSPAVFSALVYGEK